MKRILWTIITHKRLVSKLKLSIISHSKKMFSIFQMLQMKYVNTPMTSTLNYQRIKNLKPLKTRKKNDQIFFMFLQLVY